jgi:hypothetical protein
MRRSKKKRKKDKLSKTQNNSYKPGSFGLSDKPEDISVKQASKQKTNTKQQPKIPLEQSDEEQIEDDGVSIFVPLVFVNEKDIPFKSLFEKIINSDDEDDIDMEIQ